MSPIPVGACFQKSRFEFCPGQVNCFFHLAVHFNDIHAVDAAPVHHISRCFVVQVLSRHCPVDRGSHAITVVFAYKNDGEFPEFCHIQCFMKHPLICRSFTHKTNGDRIFALILCRKCRSGCQRRMTSDDAPSSHKSFGQIVEVH